MFKNGEKCGVAAEKHSTIRILFAACCMLHAAPLGQRAEQIGPKSLALLQFLDSQVGSQMWPPDCKAEWVVNNPLFLR